MCSQVPVVNNNLVKKGCFDIKWTIHYQEYKNYKFRRLHQSYQDLWEIYHKFPILVTREQDSWVYSETGLDNSNKYLKNTTLNLH